MSIYDFSICPYLFFFQTMAKISALQHGWLKTDETIPAAEAAKKEFVEFKAKVQETTTQIKESSRTIGKQDCRIETLEKTLKERATRLKKVKPIMIDKECYIAREEHREKLVGKSFKFYLMLMLITEIGTCFSLQLIIEIMQPSYVPPLLKGIRSVIRRKTPRLLKPKPWQKKRKGEGATSVDEEE